MKNPASRRVFCGCGFGRGKVPVRQTLLKAEFGRQSVAKAPRRGLNAGGNRVEIYRARRAIHQEWEERAQIASPSFFCGMCNPKTGLSPYREHDLLSLVE